MPHIELGKKQALNLLAQMLEEADDYEYEEILMKVVRDGKNRVMLDHSITVSRIQKVWKCNPNRDGKIRVPDEF
jgi:hypothetical protein